MKCLIVDDERSVRDSVRWMGQWHSFGVDAVLEAESVEAALALIERERPEIVITDMKMGVQGGVELLRAISSMKDAPRVMVLSGFSDYQYMHSAILAGAVEYLLKPVSAERFNDALCRTAALARRGEAQRPERERLQMMESAYMHATTHELAEYPMMNSFLKAHSRCMLFCLRVFDLPEVCARRFQNIPDLLFYTVQTELEEALSQKFELRLFLLQGGYYGSLEGVIALEGSDPETARRALGRAAQAVCERNGFRSMLSFSDPFTGGDALQDALLQTIQGVNYAPLNPERTLNLARPEGLEGAGRYRMSEADLEELRGLMLDGKVEAVTARADAMLEQLRRSGQLSLRNLDNIFLTLRRLMRDQLEIRGAQERLPEEYQSEEIRIQLHHFIMDSQKRRQLLSAFLEPGLKILRGSTNQLVLQMKDYIDRHYSEKINLQTLSDRFYVSREYASRMFKREMNTTFINYLTEVRLNRAAQLLLHTDASLGEIALQTGFKESSYLIRVFIKRYHMTPKEYRRSRGKGN